MLKIIDRFENDKNMFISGFINFYNESNSKYIIDKVKNANIIWYDSTCLKEDKDLLSHIVTNLSMDKLEYFLSKRKIEVFTQSAYINELNLLVLPQNYDISHIIHEMNHMIGSHIISLSPYMVINGLSYEMGKGDVVVLENDAMNEVINQLMTFDIINELKTLGMNVVYTTSWQDNAFPLLMPFYSRFKESLKELYISGNYMNFLNQFDKEKFQNFSQFIFMKLFSIKKRLRRNEQVAITREEIEIVESMINDMTLTQNTNKKR